MRRSLFAAVLLGLAVPLGAPANAQDFSSSDVVNFLLQDVEPAQESDVCIGDPADCAARQRAESFDMQVTFAFDSARLTQDARANLQEVVGALEDERLTDATFVIEGHTDGQGPEDYNQALSERRAQAVSDFLADQGIAAGRMSVFGLGEDVPRVADPMDPDNRRVELRLSVE